MSYKFLLITLLCANIEITKALEPQTMNIEIKLANKPKKHTTTSALTKGILIGCITGTTCAWFDNWWPLNWLIWMKFRSLLVKSAVDDVCYDDDEIYEKETKINDTAWVADWLSYLIQKIRQPIIFVAP